MAAWTTTIYATSGTIYNYLGGVKCYECGKEFFVHKNDNKEFFCNNCKRKGQQLNLFKE